MRQLIVLFALVTTLIGIAPTAVASPSVPLCLISNGGDGGHFTKTLLCVELHAHTASGSYSPGDTTTPHWLKVTLEVRRLALWVPLATATTFGAGPLRATTWPVGATGVLRACARVGGTTAQTGQLCSTPN